MLDHNEIVNPVFPEALETVDIVKLRLVLDFVSSCTLQPADFLGLGRIIKASGRTLLEAHNALMIDQWKALFQPELSNDPVARRKYQKPAPAFTMTLPLKEKKTFDIGDHLDCEVIFFGTSIPLIHVFIRSILHLGRLGLVEGEGQYDVTEVYSVGAHEETLVWRQGDSLTALTCPVIPLTWMLKDCQLTENVTLGFATPTRLIVNGRPLRKPRFDQIFPFILRRVTSMLYAHNGIEQHQDISILVRKARQIQCVASNFKWHDWRTVGQQNMVVGGFVGDVELSIQGLEELYWVLAVASMMGVGKGATYGAGQIQLLN